MKTLRLSLLLWLLIGSLLPASLRATHYRGAHLSYACLPGGCTYRVFVAEYFECAGMASTPTTTLIGNVTLAGGGCTPQPQGGWQLLSEQEVTPICPSLLATAGSTCDPGSGPGFPGVLERAFYRDYDLCATACGPVTVSYAHCCRQYDLDNISSLTGVNLQIILDGTACNRAPRWLEPGPLVLLAGQAAQVSLAAFDPDGDSLAYSLVDCRNTNGAPIAFASGYSLSAPLGTSWDLDLNPLTGTLAFTPLPGNQVVAALCVEVAEYREGVLLGRYTHDFSVLVEGAISPNQGPDLQIGPPGGGWDLGSGLYRASLGVPFSLPLAGSDLDGDSLILSWSQNLPGASLIGTAGGVDTLTGLTPAGTWQWTPTAPGRYSFEVDLQEVPCGFLGLAETAFVIEVDSCDFVVDLGPDTTLCPEESLLVGSPALPGYTYSWTLNTGFLTNLQAAQPTYLTPSHWNPGSSVLVLTVTAPNGCMLSDTLVISYPEAPMLSMVQTNYVACRGDTTQVSWLGDSTTTLTWDFQGALVLSGSGAGPYQLIWTQAGSYFPQVSYELGGCAYLDSTELIVDNDCVWPGDANSDGIADQYDLLALGLAYGDSGFARPLVATFWDAQSAFPWYDSLPSGIDKSHCDTDGDGFVTAADTAVILLNYGLVHNKRDLTRGGPGDPPLLLLPAVDTALVGDTLVLPIVLGVDSLPADSIYGIAFSLQYDATLVDTSAGLRVSYPPGWLGTRGSDLLTLSRDLPAEGRLDMALTRTDHAARSGHGLIAVLTIVMVDDIAGKTRLFETLSLTLTGVQALGASGENRPVSAGAAAVVVTQLTTTSLAPAWDQGLRIYPQPAHDALFLHLPTPPRTWQASLWTLTGQMVRQQEGHTPDLRLPTRGLASGLYILRISQGERQAYRRVLIR